MYYQQDSNEASDLNHYQKQIEFPKKTKYLCNLCISNEVQNAMGFILVHHGTLSGRGQGYGQAVGSSGPVQQFPRQQGNLWEAMNTMISIQIHLSQTCNILNVVFKDFVFHFGFRCFLPSEMVKLRAWFLWFFLNLCDISPFGSLQLVLQLVPPHLERKKDGVKIMFYILKKIYT